MKFLFSQLAYLMTEKQARKNLRALLKYIVFLSFVIALNTVGFHVIMDVVEKQKYSWATSFYWTLVTMSTLGFGDITFHSDVGRVFSVWVLLSGIVLLLIVLPFAFIRFFYAPWLESQMRVRVLRELPEHTRDHLILCRYDDIAQGYIDRLRQQEVPYYVLEGDPQTAAQLYEEGVSVVLGDIESRATFKALRVANARAVLANADDATNTNVTLTVREESPSVPIISIVEDRDSIDILELSGSTHVLPLKHRLGDQLASRVDTGSERVHIVGRFKNLLIAEFCVQNTILEGRTIRETNLRQLTGLNIVAVWLRGKMVNAGPDTMILPQSVLVVVGTGDQLAQLESFLGPSSSVEHPILVIGGGKVGRAAALALKKHGLKVNLVEKDENVCRLRPDVADSLYLGDAANREVLMKAGLKDATSVLLTTNNDAVNIYLTVYCRKLNPEVRIISRITHQRNVEAIHRAGADFALSYASLAVRSLMGIIEDVEAAILGEGAELFQLKIPPQLAGKTLERSQIGAKTGLNVIAIQDQEHTVSNPGADSVLPRDGEILVVGTAAQRLTFKKVFS